MENNSSNNQSKPATNGLIPNFVLVSLGFTFVALGALGLVLPVMPTTPFLLVAAACFANSSPRFHNWLLNIRVFGPLIRNWQETRSIPKKAKLLAIITIVLVGGSSVIFFVEAIFLKLLIAAILLLHIVFIANIKNTELLAEEKR
ncbi:YbaN family protein [Thiolapillus sp.]